MEATATEIVEEPVTPAPEQPTLSKNAQKKLLKKQQRKLKRKEGVWKEYRRRKAERKQQEWEEKLASLPEEDRSKIIESKNSLIKERRDKNSEKKASKRLLLTQAKEIGQNVVIDLEFTHLMTPREIRILARQVMDCYVVNGKCTVPCHLWLTGYNCKMETQLKRKDGFDKWVVERERRSYIEVMQDRKQNLVYLTSESETVLDELDTNKTYIICGMVDRIRSKGITMKKAEEQGIQTAKLPIEEYLKSSSSSQVLTVNQVLEILVKFLETKDWRTSFLHVIPECETSLSEETSLSDEEEEDEGAFDRKRTMSSEEKEQESAFYRKRRRGGGTSSEEEEL